MCAFIEMLTLVTWTPSGHQKVKKKNILKASAMRKASFGSLA